MGKKAIKAPISLHLKKWTHSRQTTAPAGGPILEKKIIPNLNIWIHNAWKEFFYAPWVVESILWPHCRTFRFNIENTRLVSSFAPRTKTQVPLPEYFVSSYLSSFSQLSFRRCIPALTSEPTQPQTQLADHNEGQPSQLVALNRQEGHTHTAPPPVAVSLSPCSVIWSRCPVRRPGRRLMRLDRQAACSMQWSLSSDLFLIEGVPQRWREVVPTPSQETVSRKAGSQCRRQVSEYGRRWQLRKGGLEKCWKNDWHFSNPTQTKELEKANFAYICHQKRPPFINLQETNATIHRHIFRYLWTR